MMKFKQQLSRLQRLSCAKLPVADGRSVTADQAYEQTLLLSPKRQHNDHTPLSNLWGSILCPLICTSHIRLCGNHPPFVILVCGRREVSLKHLANIIL